MCYQTEQLFFLITRGSFHHVGMLFSFLVLERLDSLTNNNLCFHIMWVEWSSAHAHTHTHTHIRVFAHIYASENDIHMGH